VSTVLRLRWQFCLAGYDITGQLYELDDADEARAWHADFCVIALQRDAYTADHWRIAGSDAHLPDQADRELFANPTAALDYLATRRGFTYEITTDHDSAPPANSHDAGRVGHHCAATPIDPIRCPPEAGKPGDGCICDDDNQPPTIAEEASGRVATGHLTDNAKTHDTQRLTASHGVQQPGNLTGAYVEYHGSRTAWHGHRLTISDRRTTDDGPRYTLTDQHGRQVLTNVSPGSVTPVRTALTRVWADRLAAIHTAVDKAGTDYARQHTHFIDDVAALVERHHYVHAQRALLDLEMVIGLITAETYRARMTELDAAHGPPPHAAP
jgi:hypothetical protein